MSEADKPSFAEFGKLVPGFDFLQNLTKQAAGGATQNIPQLPNLGSWIAPTLNVEDLDKRIEELKTVQFWLDQNAMALKATIQALEVQKMTLATLKGMNFNMGDVANVFKLKVADTVAGGVQKVADKAKTFSGFEIPPTSFQATADDKPKARPKAAAGKTDTPAPGVVDPMQWWGALTQQFQNIAATAMQDAAQKTALNATKTMATGLAKEAARGRADSAGRSVGQGARAAINTALRSSQARPTPAAPKTASRATPKPKTPARKTARKTATKATR